MARQAVDTYGLPRDVAPAQALLDEVARTAGHVEWLADIVRSLDPDALVWGKTKEESGRAPEPADDGDPVEVDPTTITRTAGPSVWLALYQWERKHLTEVCKTAIAAGIAERQVKLAEQHGHLIADVLRKVLADPELGLTDAQRKVVPTVARRHLSLA